MEFETLNQLLSQAVETYRKPDALRFRDPGKDGAWQSLSSDEWLARSRRIAAGLHELGVRHGDRVALLSENRVEWFLTDAAIQILGAVNVPVYATLPKGQAAFVLRDSESKAIFVSDPSQQEKLSEIRKDDDLPSLEHVIAFDASDAIAATPLESLEKKGKERLEVSPGLAEELAGAVEPEHLASIVYTSGTTGEPKGVMLTHRNLVSNVKASLEVLPLSKDDVAVSALPYSHVFERMVAHYLYPAAGVSVAICSNIDNVAQDLGEIRPTVVTMVPRFYEKMYARVKESVEQGSAVKKKIFDWSIEVGREHGEYRLSGEEAPSGLELKYKIATALAFKKLQQRIGGRLRFFVSGAAPLPKEIAEFFWAAGIKILEGYGLTETSPVISVNRPDRIRFGTVGQPIPGVEVEIAEDGEVLARGPNVMKGYYRREEDTRAVIDERGFFHTGDIGELSSDGYLTITDRKKDIIVTAGGKNIAPQAIEGRLKTNVYIAEIVVVGNRRKFPSALIVPDFEKLSVWCEERSLPSDDREKMAEHPDVREFILEQIESMSDDFAQYERIKNVRLLAEGFSMERGELTPTMKVKRSVVEDCYRHLIDEMYREGKAGDS